MNTQTPPPITTPGVLITTPEPTNQLAAVRALANLMDTAFVLPGGVRIGLDSVIGLIPGIGDVIGSVIGGYIVMVAAQMGVPRVVLLRMLANLGVDTVVGAVPVVGDVLDVAWKANVMNVALLEQALADPRAARRGSLWRLVGVGAVVTCLAGGAAAVTWFLLSALFRHAG